MTITTQASVYIATSLDGFIARTDGDLDWLDNANTTVTKGEDCGYNSFMSSIDVLIMGRHSYEKVLSFGNWPYHDKPVIVLSSKPINFPDNISKNISHSSETPQQLYDRLSNEGAKRLYIDGGVTIQKFLSAGLIHDITITIIPVLLGEGIPLFGLLEKDINLIPTQTTSYEFGFVQISYNVKPA